MNRLPFTDQNLEDESFKEECDRLSQKEVQDCFTSWGRWFLEDNMLCTWVCTPKSKVKVVGKLFTYNIAVEKLKDEQSRAEILQELETKPWLGREGLKDWQRAIKYLSKHSGKLVD